MKSLIVIILILVLKVLGDVFLSHGMREVGAVHLFQPSEVLGFVLRIITNPWVDVATMVLLSYTLLYMAALSWLDLSFLLPLSTLNYVLTALFAWLLLKEHIAASRWAGTLTITVGVMFVALSDQRKQQQKVTKPSRQDQIGRCHKQDRDHKK